jgi:ectoine hydroxylase-related dioxygenase (phytanoyl-CoA dioxygenase family)
MTATESTAINDYRKTLTQEQAEHFQERGYLAIGKLLDDDLIDLLRDEYDAVFEHARSAGTFRNLAIDDTDDLEAKNQAAEQMLQIMQMCERSIHFRRLLYDERILDIVEDLIGPNIQLFHDQALYKPAHCGGPVFWHQDNGYWQCAPANLVSCWLTLDDVDVANGAMHVIPGSHLQPLDHQRSDTSALLDIGAQIDSTRAVAIELPAGGLLVHHCQTLHYTPPNHTERQRRAFVIHCMTPGTRRSRSGHYIGVSFANPMLRMHI